MQFYFALHESEKAGVKGLPRVRGYLSNLKWLLKTNRRIFIDISNHFQVLTYYLSPKRRPPLRIDFRNGESLIVPSSYVFEAIAETLLENVYSYVATPGPMVVIDVGASVGDFALLASRNKNTDVFCFEPNPDLFPYLEENIKRNNRLRVRAYNSFAGRKTLEDIVKKSEREVAFLKIDCEGCEYDFLMNCPERILAKVRRISMEIHGDALAKTGLMSHLTRNNFEVHQRRKFGEGHYLYANRKENQPISYC